MRKPIVRWLVGQTWPMGVLELIVSYLEYLLPPGARVTLYRLRHQRYGPLPIVGCSGSVTVCRNADAWYGISSYVNIDTADVYNVCCLIATDYVSKGDENG